MYILNNVITPGNVNRTYIITSLSSYLERRSLMGKFQDAVCRVMHRNKAEGPSLITAKAT